MFRYRQTLHLRKSLEERFADLLKPFGIRADQANADEEQGAKPPHNKVSAEARKPDQLKPVTKH